MPRLKKRVRAGAPFVEGNASAAASAVHNRTDGCPAAASDCRWVVTMFKLITTMRRGSSTGIPAAWAVYPTLAAAQAGTVTLLRDDRVARVMIVRDVIPPAFVEWVER